MPVMIEVDVENERILKEYIAGDKKQIEEMAQEYRDLFADCSAHLEKLKSKSIYDTGENISPDDNILILQTCSFKKEYENFNKKYLLIIARRVY